MPPPSSSSSTTTSSLLLRTNFPIIHPSPSPLITHRPPTTTTTNCLSREICHQRRRRPFSIAIPAFVAMWSPLCTLMLLAGLTACCVSLPQIQYVNDKPYHLMQQTECRGGKIFEINDVQDIDECKAACLARNCRAVNLFQIGEFQFKCEILAYVHGYFPAQGAACYVSYY